MSFGGGGGGDGGGDRGGRGRGISLQEVVKDVGTPDVEEIFAEQVRRDDRKLLRDRHDQVQ